MKKLLSTILCFTLLGVVAALAQEPSLQQGAQVTAENNVVSGKPYLLWYVSNKTGCYVKASDNYNYFKVEDGDKTITDEAIFYLIKDGDLWKFQSKKTGKYFPVPTRSTTFVPVADVAAASSWNLKNLEQANRDQRLQQWCGRRDNFCGSRRGFW